jgi:hypothetical protein
VLRARLLAAVDVKPAFADKCATGGRLNLRKVLDLPSLDLVPEAWPLRLRVGGFPGHRYLIAASTNFATWTALQTNLMDGDEWIFVDVDSTNQPLRFYRALPGP